MAGRAEGEDALLGARLLLIAPRAAEGGIEAVFVQRLAQRHRLHDVGVRVGPVVERVDPIADTFLVHVNQKLKPELARHAVAKRDHLAKLPGRVHMQKRKRRARGIKRLQRKMHQNRRILPNRIKHNRVRKRRRNLPEYVDRFRLKTVEMA